MPKWSMSIIHVFHFFLNLRLLVAGALGLKATLSTLSSGGLRFEVEGEN